MSTRFLEKDDIKILTGSPQKRIQIKVLQENNIPFFLNAAGWPVVTVAAVEGRKIKAADEKQPWSPAVLNHAA